MPISLSNLVDNLSERLYSDKCTDCKSCLGYMSVKDDQLIFKCPKCNKNHNKDLINRFVNTYKFCDADINKFILLLRKGVYPCEYIDTWEGFHKKLLPNKEEFYSGLNMEGITDVDYRQAKKCLKI